MSEDFHLYHAGIFRIEWKNKKKSSQRFGHGSRESFRLAVAEEKGQ
jgi:hypothetical protein